MVEHASTVLPPTMLALEKSASGSEREVEVSAQSWARAAENGDTSARDIDESDDDDENDNEPPAPPPTDLTEHRRRLLVAGLTRVRP